MVGLCQGVVWEVRALMRPTQPFPVDWHLAIDLSLVLNVDRSAEGHAVNFDVMNLSNNLPMSASDWTQMYA